MIDIHHDIKMDCMILTEQEWYIDTKKEDNARIEYVTKITVLYANLLVIVGFLIFQSIVQYYIKRDL